MAGRYATAIFELAQEENALGPVEADLSALKAMIGESSDLSRLVRSQAFGHDAQARAMKGLLAGMQAHTLTTQFVMVVVGKRRLFALPGIIDSFGRLLANLRGEVQAEVTSARPLSDGETAELIAVLKARLGREPKLESRIDPGLLGGLIVKVGSRMIDSSLRSKLTGIRLAMRGN